MGRKKEQFIDKNKAITFKLSYRDNEDPFFQRQHNGEAVNVERVFEIKSMPMDDYLTQEEIKKRNKLLSLFTEEDQGIFEQAPKPKEPEMNKFWVPPEIRKKLAGKDLWIDQLAQKSQLQEQDVEDYEIEELEDVEEIEGDEEEQEEFTDEEEEEIVTDKNQLKKKAATPAAAQKKVEEQKQDEDDTGSEDYSYDGGEEEDHYNEEDRKYIKKRPEDEEEEEQNEDEPQKKIEELTSEDFPDFKYKNAVQKKIVEDNIIPKYDKITFSSDVKFKKFNEYGLPAGKFDYSKYFVQPHQKNDGVVEAILLADYKTAPKLKEDIDYEYDEMTEEQKEVFDALNNEDEDVAYEELEDDFVNIATEGQQAIIQDLVEEEIEEQVTGQKKNKTKGRKINFTFDDEGKIQLEMEKPSTKKKVVKKVIKKYEHDDSKPSQTVVTEKDKEFEKVMKEMEDSDDDANYNGSGDEDYDIPELQEGILTGEGFNKILDSHIAGMSDKNKEQFENEEKKIKSKKVNMEFEDKQRERLQKYEGFFKPEEIVTRRIYEAVPMDKDNALKSYIEREIKRDEDPNFQDENFERPEAEYQVDETIATKNFSFSRVHENLTFIGNDINLSRSKKYKNLRNADDEEHKKDKEDKNVEQISEDEDEQEEEEDEKDPLKVRSYELSKKLDIKNETKEEKAARKQALKEFKDARKQKKKLFKEGFETLTKEHQSKFQNRTNHHNIQNVKGISIKQMM